MPFHNPKLLFILPFCLLSWNCARQGFPPGGPADTTPPRLLQVIPSPDSTRVGRNTTLLFLFSEKIDPKSFERSIFITPSPVRWDEEEHGLQFKWRGSRVEVRFPDSLQANRTYVVTVGAEARDLRNNRMKDSFSFAFSTGDSLDRGEIRGRIFSSKTAGTLILAYIREENRDPDPARQFADYYSQPGESGEFALTNLATGTYRVFALSDADGDRLYTRGEEMIGVPPGDVKITPQALRARPLSLRLAAEDTLLPALVSVSAASRQYLVWSFDEAVAPRDSLWAGHMHFISAQGDSGRIAAAVPHPLDPAQIHALTSTLQETIYRARVDSVYDQSGKPLDSLRSAAEFTGTTQPDTLPPRVLRISIADSARNILLPAPLDFYFSEIMQTDTAAALLVSDSAGAAVAGNLHWPNPLQLRFQPQPRWQSRSRYTARLRPENLKDWSGNVLFDTTGSITFWTINADTFASISGKIIDPDSTAQGGVQVFAKQIQGGTEYHLRLEGPGPYLFREVLPGSYQISGFRDANRNGRFDYGSAFPFVPAERYVVWPDTIKVRSRWPNEENDFELPE